MAHVELLHSMGDDLMVVNAARVSFAKEATEFKEQDAKLINYLAKHNHISPFFHPQIQFRIKMPIFVAREWYRHQIGFSRNEVSRRYVNDTPECWIPSLDDFREKDTNKKQGSKETAIEYSHEARGIFNRSVETAIDTYEALLRMNVAPEIARTVLPQSMYTEFIETGSLAAYARLYKLRKGPDAQREIQVYAGLIGDILAEKFPVSWKALVGEYRVVVPKTSDCNGDGSCFEQCFSDCRVGHVHIIGGPEESDVYNQKKCVHKCELVKCKCGVEFPKWYLNCHKGTCMNCAMGAK